MVKGARCALTLTRTTSALYCRRADFGRAFSRLSPVLASERRSESETKGKRLTMNPTDGRDQHDIQGRRPPGRGHHEPRRALPACGPFVCERVSVLRPVNASCTHCRERAHRPKVHDYIKEMHQRVLSRAYMRDGSRLALTLDPTQTTTR